MCQASLFNHELPLIESFIGCRRFYRAVYSGRHYLRIYGHYRWRRSFTIFATRTVHFRLTFPSGGFHRSLANRVRDAVS
jgi:hypothetical protein